MLKFVKKTIDMGLFSNLFGGGRNERVQELLNEGAVIIDVRTKGEFQSNHVQGSKNIPLPELRGKVKKIKAMNKPVVVCCASGVRSGQAKSILEKEGITVENGGGWRSLA